MKRLLAIMATAATTGFRLQPGGSEDRERIDSAFGVAYDADALGCVRACASASRGTARGIVEGCRGEPGSGQRDLVVVE